METSQMDECYNPVDNKRNEGMACPVEDGHGFKRIKKQNTMLDYIATDFSNLPCRKGSTSTPSVLRTCNSKTVVTSHNDLENDSGFLESSIHVFNNSSLMPSSGNFHGMQDSSATQSTSSYYDNKVICRCSSQINGGEKQDNIQWTKTLNVTTNFQTASSSWSDKISWLGSHPSGSLCTSDSHQQGQASTPPQGTTTDLPPTHASLNTSDLNRCSTVITSPSYFASPNQTCSKTGLRLSDIGYESQLDLSTVDSVNVQHQLSQFMPCEPDRLIGKKIALEYVDVLSELDGRRMDVIIRRIVRFLSDQDVCHMSCVSHGWQDIVTQDKCINQRRKLFLKKQRLQSVQRQKENVPQPKDSERQLTIGKSPFAEVQHTAKPCQHESPAVALAGKTLQYWQEASRLKNDESLRKCPKCGCPSRAHTVQERARCSNTACNYDFCIKCRSPFHGAKDCALALASLQVKRKPDKVGSKSNKKNLRRL